MTFALVIDPGHGGRNTGTVHNGIVEKDLTLRLAKMTEALMPDDVDTILTRYEDVELSQAERGKLSKDYSADFVLSIHVNALSSKPGAHGLEAYHWPGSPVSRLASMVMVENAPLTLRQGRVIAPDGSEEWHRNARAILAAHKAPTVLAEVGYATNFRDAQYLLDTWGQRAIALCLAAGIASAFRAIKKRRGG